MTLENIIRSEPRYVSVLAATLRDSVIDTAVSLWPELTRYQERRRLLQPSREFDRRDAASAEPKLPRWRRADTHGGQGLVEYALLIALIAIVAIVAVLFLGEQVKALLSGIGESI